MEVGGTEETCGLVCVCGFVCVLENVQAIFLCVCESLKGRALQLASFNKCMSLRSTCLADLPLLESIGKGAFAQCMRLSIVDFNISSFRSIGAYAFLQSFLRGRGRGGLTRRRWGCLNCNDRNNSTIGKPAFFKVKHTTSAQTVQRSLLPKRV